MSDYPSMPSYPTGYGARDQQNPPYLPPTYPNQYLQADDSQQAQTASHYDTSMSAYGYNRSIPSFSASAVAAGVPPLPIFQGWNQDSVPLPPYTTSNNGTQYSGYTNSAQNSAPYYPQLNQPAYQPQIPGSKPFDQGDLDEGEYEDPSNEIHTPVASFNSQFREHGGTGYTDSAQRAIYSKANEYSPQQSAYPANNHNYSPRDSSRNRRQQSGSYSPYIPSSDEQSQTAKYNSYAPIRPEDGINGTPQSQHDWSRNDAGSSVGTKSQINGNRLASKVDVEPAPTQATSTTNGRSVSESRRKAQSAILNLWPYDVRYQTYIDEGFSKEVVGSLFDELKMTRNSVKSTNEESTLGALSVGLKQQIGKENIPSGPSNSAATSGPPGIKTDSNAVGKDRTSLGPSASSANTGGKQTLAGPNPTAALAKPAAMTEKEKTLQSKMEALRKSREERAQKAAAKTVSKPPTTNAEAPIPQVEQAKTFTSNPTTSPSPLTTSSVPAPPSTVDSNPLTSNTSATLANPPQQLSKIPGLFLASGSSNAPAAISSSKLSSSSVNTVRKRPVAADFDTPTPMSTPFKRPFGHSRADQRLVITVSDDEADSEDEDVAMDLESQATQDSPTQSARRISDHRSAAVQNLPPLSNFPQRKPYTSPPNSSAANTPPLPNVPDTAGRLTHVQSEMEKLRKQIALREARQRAKQASSRSRTPQVSEDHGSSTNIATPPAASIASKVETSIQIQEMIETASTNVAINQQRLADAQAAEVTKSIELKESEDEQKRLRREKLAADIPRVDAEVQQNQSKLEQLRAEMARIEASVQKSLEDKRLLAEEMERLGQEAEDQLQAQKDKLEDLSRQDSTMSEDSSLPNSTIPVTEPSQTAQPTILQPAILQPAILQPAIPQPANTNGTVHPEDMETRETQSSINDAPGSETIKTTPVNGNKTIQDDHSVVSSSVQECSSETVADPKESDVRRENASTDRALEAALQEAVRAEADSHAQEEDDMDSEDFYAPDPTQSPPRTPMQVSVQTGSPEYSPTLDRSIPDVPGESDDYEPPEATPPIDERSALESPPFSPAPPEIISEVDNDESLDVDMSGFEPAAAANDVEKGHRKEEILPSTNGSFPPVVEAHQEAVDKHELFTPYESPLKQFKAYRFHPSFKEDVAGGLKSKTYSHKIDLMEELCRFETAGGICNDTSCDFQHFRDIDLPDDAILTALGSPEEFKGEQRDRFCMGLRGVLMDLRVRKIRDFDVIASEIMSHRAKFLGDKSKVLAALEGTTI
ncbi:hypothetical protein ONS95_004206 [Cadophora gregata]|uniref:uncharacterized protein n=1 Tax=Cadophora gregata TaxID=51156 RepID=UPI0026DCFD7C|nr:uncharacterized protein ONS95_004206 [Cadophora gregata]KAK0105679.1 hypothetical protein ONS95_004206 [Cadophora gregata]